MAAPKKNAQPQLDLAALIQHAVAYQRLGQLDEAEALYRRVLDTQPDHFDALHLCGTLMQQRGRPADALRLIGAALSANGKSASAHSNYGLVLAALGRAEEALASYARAIALKPDHAEALYNQGNALAMLGRYDEALASLGEALARRPNYAAALINRAQVLQRLGRLRDAINSFDRAFALAPPNADALVARGNLHYELGSFAAALSDYDRALSLRPDAAPLHNNRGNALRELSRHADALASFDRAIALKPHYDEAHNNRGNAQLEMNRPAQALADYERALSIKPDSTDALVNRASALRYLNRFDDALASLDRAIALDPELAEARWNRALACLTFGDFEAGWRDYEWRWRRNTREMVARNFVQPQWRGEDLDGKTILLHAEQGFGDSIQFIRYLPMVAAKCGQVVLEIPDDLRPLVPPIDGVVALVSRGEPLPPFDLHCPLLSLPLAFGTTVATIPAEVPYLAAPSERIEKWRKRLPDSKTPRIGLVWSGKPTHKNDHNRSIALASLKPLLASAGCQFISLQKEYRERDVADLKTLPHLVRLDEALVDFADTAAVVAMLDLVIAVDTAVAHLAGAIGKPVWILLPTIGDWRWMADRNDSPWYPTARLFRQQKFGDWDSVIARVGQELGAAIEACRSATA
jgi:tetratricopeptide (TPR) repeat protein